MKPRLNYGKVAPGTYDAMDGLDRYLQDCSLEKALIVLVQLRASQINGCAYCLDMHVAHLLAEGVDAHRLHQLAAWRESPSYSARERAALAWCEALTLLADTGAPDADYEAMASVFTPAERVTLTFAIGAINVWNRLMVGFRVPPRAERAA